MEGTVQEGSGVPLAEARVVVTDARSGVSRSLRTDRDGRFRIELLPPGEYDVFAEFLGYRPQRVAGVPVRPGRTEVVRLELEPTSLPVQSVDAVVYERSAIEGSRSLSGQWFSPFQLQGLPDHRRELSGVSRLSSRSDETLSIEGLPGRLTAIKVDGVGYEAPAHPDLPINGLRTAAFPLSSLDYAELVTNAVDVEWSGSAGAMLSGYTRGSTGQLAGAVTGDWTGHTLTRSSQFDVDLASPNSFRGVGVITGPLVRDTAHFVLGAEVQRLESGGPAPFQGAALDPELLGVARDSFGVDLRDWQRAEVVSTEVIAGYGRFYWLLSRDHFLQVRSNFSTFRQGGDLGGSPGLRGGVTSSLGSEIRGTDYFASASLLSSLSQRVQQELRIGVEVGSRDFNSGPFGTTQIVDAGLAFGTDPSFPAELDRSALRLRQTLHVGLGRHRLKLGAAGTLEWYDQIYSYGREGLFIFPGLPEFSLSEGVFRQSVGPTPAARFSRQNYGLFVQDAWSVAPGLDLRLGLRYDLEKLPRDDVVLNEAWFRKTGLANTDFDNDVQKWSPRFGFSWDVGRPGEWLVQGDAGIYHGLAESGLLGELVTNDATVRLREAVGPLGSWPATPDSVIAGVGGAQLTLLGLDFQGPRTGRVTLSIARILGSGMTLTLSGTYRHTDFLPRRHDLNRPQAPRARDVHGRPIYGQLMKQGALVTPVPESNRRLPEFGLVSALDSDGFSDYWGVTTRFERHVGEWIKFAAAYTWSRTRDNWLVGRGGGPSASLTPFPDSLGGVDWAEGISDFDVRHRLAAGFELDLKDLLNGVGLAGSYAFRSGRPFTPGFRDGVDLNADGSSLNDPAYVDRSIGGMNRILRKWDCVKEQVGHFVERNSCRGPSLHRLDARLGINMFGSPRGSVKLVIDLLNLLDDGPSVIDDALYMVDPDAPLTLDESGNIRVPLVANPGFGDVRTVQSSGRSLRIGIQANF